MWGHSNEAFDYQTLCRPHFRIADTILNIYSLKEERCILAQGFRIFSPWLGSSNVETEGSLPSGCLESVRKGRNQADRYILPGHAAYNPSPAARSHLLTKLVANQLRQSIQAASKSSASEGTRVWWNTVVLSPNSLHSLISEPGLRFLSPVSVCGVTLKEKCITVTLASA